MGQATTQDLFRKAISHDDTAAMREGLERLLGIADGLIPRETRYYAHKSDPPAWRSTWVEEMEQTTLRPLSPDLDC